MHKADSKLFNLYSDTVLLLLLDSNCTGRMLIIPLEGRQPACLPSWISTDTCIHNDWDENPQVGVENIREHMRQQESVQEEINRQKVELSKQAARIRSQITYERKADLRPAVAALEASIRECAAFLKCPQFTEIWLFV